MAAAGRELGVGKAGSHEAMAACRGSSMAAFSEPLSPEEQGYQLAGFLEVVTLLPPKDACGNLLGALCSIAPRSSSALLQLLDGTELPLIPIRGVNSNDGSEGSCMKKTFSKSQSCDDLDKDGPRTSSELGHRQHLNNVSSQSRREDGNCEEKDDCQIENWRNFYVHGRKERETGAGCVDRGGEELQVQKACSNLPHSGNNPPASLLLSDRLTGEPAAPLQQCQKQTSNAFGTRDVSCETTGCILIEQSGDCLKNIETSADEEQSSKMRSTGSSPNAAPKSPSLSTAPAPASRSQTLSSGICPLLFKNQRQRRRSSSANDWGPKKSKRRKSSRTSGTLSRGAVTSAGDSIVQHLKAMVTRGDALVNGRVLRTVQRNTEQRLFVLLDLYLPSQLWLGTAFWRESAAAASVFLDSHLSTNWEARSHLLEKLHATPATQEPKNDNDFPVNFSEHTTVLPTDALDKEEGRFWDPLLGDCHVLGCQLHHRLSEAERTKRFSLTLLFRNLPPKLDTTSAPAPATTPAILFSPNEEQPSGILSLPEDVLSSILSRVDAISLRAAERTCHHLRAVGKLLVPNLKLSLFPHQRSAMRWMLEREDIPRVIPHPFVRGMTTMEGFSYFASVITGDVRVCVEQREKNTQRKGGSKRVRDPMEWPGVVGGRASSESGKDKIAVEDGDSGYKSRSPLSQRDGRVAYDLKPDEVMDFRGGMFCDEPGLGKTITALALILKTLGTLASPPPGAASSIFSHPSRHRYLAGYYELGNGNPVRCNGSAVNDMIDSDSMVNTPTVEVSRTSSSKLSAFSRKRKPQEAFVSVKVPLPSHGLAVGSKNVLYPEEAVVRSKEKGQANGQIPELLSPTYFRRRNSGVSGSRTRKKLQEEEADVGRVGEKRVANSPYLKCGGEGMKYRGHKEMEDFTGGATTGDGVSMFGQLKKHRDEMETLENLVRGPGAGKVRMERQAKMKGMEKLREQCLQEAMERDELVEEQAVCLTSTRFIEIAKFTPSGSKNEAEAVSDFVFGSDSHEGAKKKMKCAQNTGKAAELVDERGSMGKLVGSKAPKSSTGWLGREDWLQKVENAAQQKFDGDGEGSGSSICNKDNKGGVEAEQMQNEALEVSFWAECDGCHKWRKLPAGTPKPRLAWFCQMNPDKGWADCKVPQESAGEENTEMLLGFRNVSERDSPAASKIMAENVAFFRECLDFIVKKNRKDLNEMVNWLVEVGQHARGRVDLPLVVDGRKLIDGLRGRGGSSVADKSLLVVPPNLRAVVSEHEELLKTFGLVLHITIVATRGSHTSKSTHRGGKKLMTLHYPEHVSPSLVFDTEALEECWNQRAALEQDQKKTLGRKRSMIRNSSGRIYLSNATLIVVPANLIPHWRSQVEQHTTAGQLRVYVWDGTDSHPPLPHSLAWDYDIVLTTFNRLSVEWNRGGRGAISGKGGEDVPMLMRVHWFRIILDEGHTLGASLALTNKLQMAVSLKAERRWLLTGTPTPNTPSSQVSHLHPLLKFLHESVFGEQHRLWEVAIQRPFEAGKEEARARLEALLKRCMISALKSSIKFLPNCFRKVTLLEFSEGHAASYNELVETVQRNILMADWYDPDHVESLLNPKQWQLARELLKNVRLSCCVAGHMHIQDVGTDIEDTMQLLTEQGLDRLSERWELIQKALKFGGLCDRCQEWCRLPMVTPCRHLLCLSCAAVARTHCALSLCGKPYKMQANLPRADNPNPKWTVPEDLIEMQPSYAQHSWSADWSFDSSSSKVSYLVQQLQKLRETNEKMFRIEESGSQGKLLGESGRVQGNAYRQEKPYKAIIFSQFLEHISMVENQLRKAQIPFAGMYSPKPSAEKANALEEFKHPHCLALLMDHQGALGLDLSFATHVFLLEPIWDRSLEEQIIARAWRMGASQDVEVETLAMRGTIEEHMLAVLQDPAERGSARSQREMREVTARTDILKRLILIRKSGKQTSSDCSPDAPSVNFADLGGQPCDVGTSSTSMGFSWGVEEFGNFSQHAEHLNQPLPKEGMEACTEERGTALDGSEGRGERILKKTRKRVRFADEVEQGSRLDQN